MEHSLDYNTENSLKGRSLVWLRRFSKLLVASTLFLIFAGSLVTSTDSGLSVPDWPNTYGQFMFSFPLADMVGGIFYEHGHRMIASTVGLLTVIMAVWVAVKERRGWLKKLSLVALVAVICQGLLGGLTVLFFLPTPVSMMHAILAQTFLVITIVMAYGLSRERRLRALKKGGDEAFLKLVPWILLVVATVYAQLFLGALMRHTGSGLAIPDFPTMAGSLIPSMNDSMVQSVNLWRFHQDLDPIVLSQIWIHLVHRIGAVFVLVAVGLFLFRVYKYYRKDQNIFRSSLFLAVLILIQACFGAATVLSTKHMMIASLHVVLGASILGVSVLLLLRCLPLQWAACKQSLRRA